MALPPRVNKKGVAAILLEYVVEPAPVILRFGMRFPIALQILREETNKWLPERCKHARYSLVVQKRHDHEWDSGSFDSTIF